MVPHSPHVSPESRAVLLVPIYNPGSCWHDYLSALRQQARQPDQVQCPQLRIHHRQRSSGPSPRLFRSNLQRSQFNHGGTRNAGIDQHAIGSDLAIFFTQVAILARPDAMQQMLSAFDEQIVAATFGRQSPHANATPIAAHARLFNYPALSQTVTLQDKSAKGIKTYFLSNSFAAYRLSALQQAGGLAPDLILGEDMHLAVRLLLGGTPSATRPALTFIGHKIMRCEKNWPATWTPGFFMPGNLGS